VTGLPVTIPWSLPKATKLPERVTPPIRVLRAIVLPEATSRPPAPTARAASATTDPAPPGSRGWARRNSAAATTADAPPPSPLKMPTSWGISVISTVRARTSPIREPRTTPTRIAVQSRTWFSTRVATIATSMALAARALPLRADAGEPIRLSPKTKRIADRR